MKLAVTPWTESGRGRQLSEFRILATSLYGNLERGDVWLTTLTLDSTEGDGCHASKRNPARRLFNHLSRSVEHVYRGLEGSGNIPVMAVTETTIIDRVN